MCIINETPEIQFHQTTRSTPEQFVTGLIDFGPGRSNLFSNSSESAGGRSTSGGIWKRLLYGWSTSEMAPAEQEYWGRH